MVNMMIDIILHAGTEHPNLAWVLIPSILSFLAGLGIGGYSERLREWLPSQNTETTK